MVRQSGASEWLTTAQAAEVLSVSPSTVRAWADGGVLTVYRTPRNHRRFKRADIERVIELERQAS